MSKYAGIGLPVQVGSYKPASQVAKQCNVTEERLLALADAGIAPHIRIDDGPPLFALGQIKKWVEENLVTRHGGAKMPKEAIVYVGSDNLTHCPPMAISGLAGLRELSTHHGVCGVYFLCRRGEVVYVGQSINVHARIYQHQGIKDFDSVFYICVPPDELDNWEGAFIRLLNPQQNGGAEGKKVGPTTRLNLELVKKSMESVLA